MCEELFDSVDDEVYSAYGQIVPTDVWDQLCKSRVFRALCKSVIKANDDRAIRTIARHVYGAMLYSEAAPQKRGDYPKADARLKKVVCFVNSYKVDQTCSKPLFKEDEFLQSLPESYVRFHTRGGSFRFIDRINWDQVTEDWNRITGQK